MYFKIFGNSVGYTEKEIEEGLFFCNYKIILVDFLQILNDLKEKKLELKKKNFFDEILIDGFFGTNFFLFFIVLFLFLIFVNGRRSFFKEYKKKLVEDFVEEIVDLFVDELKKRNVERQRLFKFVFDNGISNVSEFKLLVKKKRRKKKRKKSVDIKKFIGDGFQENLVIFCSLDDDKE